MVWDASEKGLGFQAVAGVQASCPIKLRISPNPISRIELSAIVVWTDKSKKFGGLRFTELCDDARERIRAWLAECPAPTIADQEIAPPHLPKEKSVGIGSNAEQGTGDFLSVVGAPHEAHPARAGADTTTIPSLAPFVSPALLRKPPSPKGPLFVSRLRRLNGVSITLLIVVVLLAPIFVTPNFRAAFGTALIRLGEKLKGNSQAQTDPSPSSLARTSGQDSPVSPRQLHLNAESLSAESPEKPASSTPIQATSGSSNSQVTRLSEGRQSAQHFADPHFARRRSAVAQRLWTEIGAGDVTAEVALAQLYLAGDGVPRSCAQARILLRAASRSGNTDALQQLRNLKGRGCR
jgi:hypothetical protein